MNGVAEPMAVLEALSGVSQNRCVGTVQYRGEGGWVNRITVCHAPSGWKQDLCPAHLSARDQGRTSIEGTDAG